MINYTRQFEFVLRFIDFRLYVYRMSNSHKEAIQALLALAND